MEQLNATLKIDNCIRFPIEMSGQGYQSKSFILEYSDLLMSMTCKQSNIIGTNGNCCICLDTNLRQVEMSEHGFNENDVVLNPYFDRCMICIVHRIN